MDSGLYDEMKGFIGCADDIRQRWDFSFDYSLLQFLIPTESGVDEKGVFNVHGSFADAGEQAFFTK